MRLLVSLLFLVSLYAQPPQPPPPQDGKQKRAPQPPKNLKILQPDQIRTVMPAFKAALGVEGCTHCHVSMQDFASDDNPKKEIARNMILLTKDINAKFPDGQMHVSCFTCHRGAVTPAMAPPKAPAPPADAK